MSNEFKMFLDGFSTDELRQKVQDAAKSYGTRCEMVRDGDEDALRDIFGSPDIKNIDALTIEQLTILRDNAFNLVHDGVGGRFINKIINDMQTVIIGCEIISARVQTIRS